MGTLSHQLIASWAQDNENNMFLQLLRTGFKFIILTLKIFLSFLAVLIPCVKLLSYQAGIKRKVWTKKLYDTCFMAGRINTWNINQHLTGGLYFSVPSIWLCCAGQLVIRIQAGRLNNFLTQPWILLSIESGHSWLNKIRSEDNYDCYKGFYF